MPTRRFFGESSFPSVIAYHFTTKTNADHIRSQGFVPSEELFGSPVVWLTRNPEDSAARKRGDVRLTVTMDADHWLMVSPGTTRSLNTRRRARSMTLMQTLGRGDETLDAFVRRKGYAGIWYTDLAQPWLAVFDPCALTLADLSATSDRVDGALAPRSPLA